MLKQKIDGESESGEEKGGGNYSCPYGRRVHQIQLDDNVAAH